MNLLLWMHVILDFICMRSNELLGTGGEQTFHNENIRLQLDLNYPFFLPRSNAKRTL